MVKGQHDDIYSLTAKQLYEQISNNSKLDYNLIASASKLLKICKKPSFPAEYELAIKCTILNCFAIIEHRASCGGDRYIVMPADQEAVQEYISQEKIDFKHLVEVSHKEFVEIVKKAEIYGAFDEDKKSEIESWKNFYKILNNMDI